VCAGPKSLIKWGWWLQSIHKFRFINLVLGSIVKDCGMLVRLGGVLVVVVYTSVGRYWFPNRRPVRRARDGAPGVVWGLRRTGNGKGKGGLIVSCQRSAMSCQLRQRQQQWQAQERVYIPHLRIEMWGTPGVCGGLGGAGNGKDKSRSSAFGEV
jgi:hypothetical protein